MTANTPYSGRKDSFCDYSRNQNFVRASELRDSDYRSLVVPEASDDDVREAIFALEDSEGRRARDVEAVEHAGTTE